MSGSVCLICVSLIFYTVVPYAWCQSHEPESDDLQERPVVPQDSEVERIRPEDPRARLKGLCRDGWSPGTMKDFSGKEIPVCLKINPEALTWSEAQDSCRRDYGFLMKFDSRATVDASDLLTSVIVNGINKFWTGMHSENGHLIWDDLIPNQVRPHNRLNDSSVPERPWTWETLSPEKRLQYCGQMNVKTEDRRRRKRSSDDDSNDNNFPTFDLSEFRNPVFNNNNFRRPMHAFPQTSAFQSELSRTQMSDQLPELQGTPGLQSEHQIPGSGLPDANIQNGGLATHLPTFEPNANFEQLDTETVTPFGILNTGDSLNTESNENPTSNPTELLTDVKELAASIGSNVGVNPDPLSMDAAETLRNLIQENADNFKAENAATMENQDFFGSETTVIPPTTISTSDSNGNEVSNVGKVDDATIVDGPDLIGTNIDSVLTDNIVDDSSNLHSTEANVMDVFNALTSETGDGTENLHKTNAKVDESTEQMTNAIIDESAITDNVDRKVGSISPINEITNATFLGTVFKSNEDLLGEKRKTEPESVADDLKTAAGVSISSGDVTSDDTLGYGQMTDLLTNEAVSEALNTNNLKENAVSTEEILKDVLDGTLETELHTQLYNNDTEVLSIFPDETEDSVKGNIDSLGTAINVNGNSEAAVENVADKISDLLGDAENISNIPTEESKNQNEDSMLNVGLENQDDIKENLEQTTPGISSFFDTPASDIQKSNKILTDVNEDVSALNQMTANGEDTGEILNEKNGENPSEIISNFEDHMSDVIDELDVLTNNEELENESNLSENESLPFLQNVSDVNEVQDDTIKEELYQESKDDKADKNSDAFLDDTIADITDGLMDTEEAFAPKDEIEPVNTELFEDMADRLGLSEKTKGNEEMETVGVERPFDINEDPLDSVKDQSDLLFDQELPDELKTDTETAFDNLETIEAIKESEIDKNDDYQTKRDSDWSEFDWIRNEQNENENPTSDFNDYDQVDTSEFVQDGFKTDGDIYQNDGKGDLNENFEKENEDDKSFQKNENYDSGKYDDLNDKIIDASSLQTETDTDIETKIPESSFEDREQRKQNVIDTDTDTDKEEITQKVMDKVTEVETDIPDSYFEDKEEEIPKETAAEIETEIPDSYFEDKEERTQSITDDTDAEVETETPDSYFEGKEEGTQTMIDTDTDVETEIPDSYYEDKEGGAQIETDTEMESEVPDSYIKDKEELDRINEIPDLAEDMVESDRKTALVPEIESKEMQLSSCDVKLPSVCFSYEVEVMDKASTCENGWYGHVLLDTCYMILEKRMTYVDALSECKSRSARLVLAGSGFERMFVLLAVQKDATLFRGAKFWMESSSDNLNCKFFDERGVHTMQDCNGKLNAVCVKDAKSLSVYTTNNMPIYGGDVSNYYDGPGEQRTFLSKRKDNKLPCKLTSAASEFPVLWFKDGVLVETKDTYISTDISLYLNAELVSSVGMVTDRDLATPVLQGQYWCEVWDRQTLTRKRSRSLNVRFSDIISFHGSMELPSFSHKDELLFNMANRKFPELSAAELDIKKVFTDVLPMLQARLPDVTDVFTFLDGIRSNPNVIEYHTYFTLNRDYKSQDEDIVYNKLKALLRSKLGNRYYMASLPGQTPLSAFRTMSLQSTVSCPAATLQTTRDLYGHTIPVMVFSFPKAGLGEYANSIDNCSITNQLPSGTARCLGDFYTGAYWGDIVANECIEEGDIDQFNNEIWGASPYTDTLTEMAQVTVDERNVEKLVSEVAQIAKVAPKFTPTDINKIADVLDHTTQVRNLPQKVGEDVLKTVDRLMAISEKEAHVANVETKAANRIIKSLERYAEHADIGTKDQVRLVSDNVVVEIWNLKPSNKLVIGLAAETSGTSIDKPFKTESIATVYNKSQLYAANVDAAIELPTEVFSLKEKGASVSDRLTMMVFRKSKLFKAAITDGGRKMSPTEQQLSNLNSYVVSASIAGRKLQNLNEKVKTIFKPIKDVESERSCVWWDFDMNNFKGGWSNKGCVYDGKVNGRDVCLCDHLTNFAVLIDFYGQSKPIPDHHELSLSIITVLGLSCSILGLSLTIISYLFFRKLRQGRAQQTLFNLSLSLLLSMLVFLVGVKQTHNYYGCITVAILLHYLILVSFMWMLMEAILQYLTFVKILGTYITRFTLKTVLPAWGLPLIPVIAVLCVDYTLYKGGPNYCWMDLPAFYYAFAIPVTGIIVINIIIFIVTIVSIFRRGKGLRSNQKKQKMTMTNLQAAITSFILLGLTWIFGYLAISDARLPFQYVFTILNSLQGFFIFILFVVRKKKVREQWYFICCKGIEKDRVSRSLSASNSIPSTYSNGSNRNSRKDGRERDRSDSTKTVQSTYSNSSTGFTNYGYEHGYDFPFNRYDRRNFRKF